MTLVKIIIISLINFDLIINLKEVLKVPKILKILKVYKSITIYEKQPTFNYLINKINVRLK